jgi:hypothetical protein
MPYRGPAAAAGVIGLATFVTSVGFVDVVTTSQVE